MARHGLTPDLALVSPAKRVQETWALVAPAFAKAPRLVNEERIYNATTEALVQDHQRDARRALSGRRRP